MQVARTTSLLSWTAVLLVCQASTHRAASSWMQRLPVRTPLYGRLLAMEAVNANLLQTFCERQPSANLLRCLCNLLRVWYLQYWCPAGRIGAALSPRVVGRVDQRVWHVQVRVLWAQKQVTFPKRSQPRCALIGSTIRMRDVDELGWSHVMPDVWSCLMCGQLP